MRYPPLHGARPCCHQTVACRLGADSSGNRPVGSPPGFLGAAVRSPPAADHTLARLPRAAWYRFSACGVGTGVEPVTSRLTTWRSTTELPWLTRPSVRTHVRNTRRQPPRRRTEQRAAVGPAVSESAGGSRTHLKLLCRQPPCRLAPAPSHSVPSPGIEPGLRRSHSRVLVRHTPRTFGQRPAEESNPVLQIRSLPCRPSHSQGKCLDQDSNLDLDVRTVQCDPLHHRDERAVSFQPSAVSCSV